MVRLKRLRLENKLEQFPDHNVQPKKPKKLELKMESSGAFYIPKQNPSKPLGEDAHFLSPEYNAFGIADGVGGWVRYGVDAGRYARLLMRNAVIALLDEPEGEADPPRVLLAAHAKTRVRGSSTACIVALKDGCLQAANVGDSGFLVFRDGECIYQSPQQQSRFNRPYQLGRSCGNPPSVAQRIEVPVEAGDIVVAGTDGLLDNMFPSEIEDAVSEATLYDSPEDLARTIAKMARYNAHDHNYCSPFEEAAKAAHHSHTGGKVDDITVVVAMIELV